jgi:hypothetical protein
VITGAHFLLYTTNPEADRAFLRDVIGLRAVDSGHGWLILALPPAELGVHPSERLFAQRHAERDLAGAVLYLMCDDLPTEVEQLRARGVECDPIAQAPWGSFTALPLPSGGHIGLYQPTHPTAIG